MKRLFFYFLRGLLLTFPVVVTLWVIYQLFTAIDGWLGIRIPGVGFAITIVVITLIGFLGSNLLTRGILAAVEDVIERLPLVRLVYNSTKDLIGAFVGEKRRFDKPVVVSLNADASVRGLGFITQESMDTLGTADSVVVYFPQSYAFAGWTFIVPANRVQRLETSSSDFMAFVVSGGVTGFPELKKPTYPLIESIQERNAFLRGSWDAAIPDELKPEPSDIIVINFDSSAFSHTDLDCILRAKGVRQLFLAGIAEPRFLSIKINLSHAAAFRTDGLLTVLALVPSSDWLFQVRWRFAELIDDAACFHNDFG